MRYMAARTFGFFLSAASLTAMGSSALAQTRPADERREAELQVSKRLLDRTVQIAEGTQRQYDELEEARAALQERISGLMTNDDGKKMAAALDPILAREVVLNIEAPVVDQTRLATNRKQLADLLAGLKREEANLTPGYLPPDAVIGELHTLSSWATEQSAKLKERAKWLDDQTLLVPDRFELMSAPTLNAVLRDFRKRELEAWAAARKQGADAAAEKGQSEITESARRAEAERLAQEARQQYEQAKAELERVEAQHEVALQRQHDAYEQTLSDLRAELAATGAKRATQDAKSEAVVKQGEAEAKKIRLTQEAQDPSIAEVLAPLLAKGYVQPGKRDRAIDAGPVSLAALRDVGALDRTEEGLFKLARVAQKKLSGKGSTTINRDWDRPTWGGPERWQDWTNEQRQKLLAAQDALNRLGPTLVDLNMLTP